MKALTRYCDHGEFGGYHYIDVPIPECGPDDVIISVKAAAICGADMKHWYADLEGSNTSETINSIRGHEFAGVIVKVGENVTDWHVGQRVVSDNSGQACGKCPACERGDVMLCEHKTGLGLDNNWVAFGGSGGFAKYAKIPGGILRLHPHALWEIPDGVK